MIMCTNNLNIKTARFEPKPVTEVGAEIYNTLVRQGHFSAAEAFWQHMRLNSRTGEDVRIYECPKCKAEHGVLSGELIESCDECGFPFPQPDEDNGEDQEQ